MPNLPSKKDCCGCAACVDSCLKKAISLQEDENGFFYPFIDEEVCVKCGLCEKNCHILHQNQLKRNELSFEKPYAAWTLDDNLIKASASGGVFAQIAKDFLAEGGFVYGAALQENSTVKHIEISSINDLYKLQNSKYQQSNATGIYALVKQRLKAGDRVLFSGVPCQAGALYQFLHYDEKLMQNLYVTEIVCHGVPSNHLSRIALSFTGMKKILKYRTKSQGWMKGNRVVYEDYSGTVKECRIRREDFLFRSYLSFSFSRENCYSCKYANIRRVSDLTMCDFWEYDKNKFNHHDGISLVLVNSPKGKNMLLGSKNMFKEEVTWEESIPQNQNLYMPTNRQLFIGSHNISKILKYPKWIQKIVFQNGFSNKYLNKAYNIVLNLITKKLRAKQQSEQEKLSLETLKKLSNRTI